jgi:S1/P1 Nuclease
MAFDRGVKAANFYQVGAPEIVYLTTDFHKHLVQPGPRCHRDRRRPVLHQPLHVSFEDDHGGNGVRVTGGLCAGNLHGVWDTCIIEQGLGPDIAALAAQLRASITDQQRSDWLASRPTDWANDSFAIATSPGVDYCVRTETGCCMTGTASGWSPASRRGRCWSTTHIWK